MPSCEMHEGVVGRGEALVSTTAVAGVASPADFAGAVALADLAGTDVPAVAGMNLSAVVEVHSSAVEDEGAPLVIRASRQRCTVVGAGPVWPGGGCGGLVDGMTVPEPIEHLVVGVPNEVGNSSVDIVTVPKPIEHSIVELHSEVGNSSVDIVTVPDLIEHSGVRGTADPPSAGQLMMHSEASRGLGKLSAGPHDDNTPLDVRTFGPVALT